DVAKGGILPEEIVRAGARMVAPRHQDRSWREALDLGADGEHPQEVVRRIAADSDDVVALRKDPAQVDDAEGALHVEVDHVDAGAGTGLERRGERQQLR